MYKLISLPECDSTQEEIKRLIDQNVNQYVAIFAETQKKGKGSYGREWISEPGGLYMSFNYPVINYEIPISIVFSVLTIRSLTNFCNDQIDVGFIYPNDLVVYLNDTYYKLGGILIENYKGQYIVGVGINLNNKISEYKLEHKAISLKELFFLEFGINKDFDILHLSKLIIQNVERLYNGMFNYLENLELIDFTDKLSYIEAIVFIDNEEFIDRFDKIKIDYKNKRVILYKSRMRKEVEFERLKRILY